MTWDNYGEDVFKDKVKAWHIDHIIPCNAFDFSNPTHVKACFYYKNLGQKAALMMLSLKNLSIWFNIFES